MIKLLKKRFVWSAMAAVTVLLLVLLCGINIFSAYFSARQSEQLLYALPDFEMAFKGRRDSFFDIPPNEDSRMSALYFSVHMDKDGNPVFADTRRIASIDEEKAIELSLRANLSTKGTANLDGFKYRVIPTPSGEYTLLFLDTSLQRATSVRLALLSLLVGAVCWGLMLLLVLMLSDKAIKPIAENMEKQRRFVTDAGHELKTPLAIILANTEAMELRQGENKYSRNIRHQVNRLNMLMQNLLSLSRAEEQLRPASVGKVELSQLCEQIWQEFQEAAELKELRLEKDIEKNLSINGDVSQLRQLVSILLDNAIKYSDEKGFVTMSLQGGSKVCLSVKNSVSSKDIPIELMFDRFYRGDSARTQKSGGYGIGLSAAQAISKLHGGSISAEYGSDNSICFTVKL